MSVCTDCGVPQDAGFFDDSKIARVPTEAGKRELLASYELHRNYCGMLLYFSQFTDVYATNPTEVQTPGFRWEILSNGRPCYPYLTFEHIINPWGMSGFPLRLRLEQGCLLEFVIRNVGGTAQGDKEIKVVGGRLVGRYWYDTNYGGLPNRL